MRVNLNVAGAPITRVYIGSSQVPPGLDGRGGGYERGDPRGAGEIHTRRGLSGAPLGHLAAHEFGHVMLLPEAGESGLLMSSPAGYRVTRADVTEAIRRCSELERPPSDEAGNAKTKGNKGA